MKNTSQRKKLKIEITIVIIISLITGIMAYLNQYYHAEGTPEQVAAVSGSFTGQYLRPLLERDRAQRAAEAEKH